MRSHAPKEYLEGTFPGHVLGHGPGGTLLGTLAHGWQLKAGAKQWPNGWPLKAMGLSKMPGRNYWTGRHACKPHCAKMAKPLSAQNCGKQSAGSNL